MYIVFHSVSLWIQIWGAPFDMFSPKVAAEIGGRLGEVVEVERRKNLDTQNLFMRVKVAVPISKPIRRGGFIGGSDGQRSWVHFRYERLPLFCHFCGFMGHDIKHCAEYFACAKNGSEVVCQYGEWLKSSGGRPRSPVRGSSSLNKQPTSNVRTEFQVGNDNRERSVAEVENTKENPTEEDVSAFGKCMDSGKIPDCTEKGLVTEEINMEGCGSLSSVTDAEEINSSGKSITHGVVIKQGGGLNTDVEARHVGNRNQNGLQGFKKKAHLD